MVNICGEVDNYDTYTLSNTTTTNNNKFPYISQLFQEVSKLKKQQKVTMRHRYVLPNPNTTEVNGILFMELNTLTEMS